MKVYVASSWRNEHQPGIVQALRTSDLASLREKRIASEAEAQDSNGNVMTIETDARSVFIETKGRVSIGDKIQFLRRALDWLIEQRPTMTAEDVMDRVRLDTSDRDVDQFLPPSARRYSEESTDESEPGSET